MSITPEQAAALRKPFPRESIGILPKPYKADSLKGQCSVCNGYHGLPAVHLDYVGHAAVTDRLLTVDPAWTWEPMALTSEGLPALDRAGNLWIRLTVCGVTRIGVGDGKSAKELIGDCLVTGTVITTGRGAVRIEDVRKGDVVPTRNGWKPVTDHWLSSESAPTVSVLLSNGAVIQGTPHHRVPTSNGPVRMGALRNGDMLYAWQDTEKPKASKRSHGAGASTAASLATKTVIAGSTTWQPPHPAPICTRTSTKTAMARSLMDFTSTTSTTIPWITEWRTWQRFPLRLTQYFTGKRPAGSFAPAPNAGNSSLPFATAPNGARQHARSATGAELGLLTSDRKSNPWLNHATAKSVGQNSLPADHGRGFAPVYVVAVLAAEPAPVWNISVDGPHEYVANGILVHNSIRNAAMRFGVALDLWSKEELEGIDEHVERPTDAARRPAVKPATDEPMTVKTRGRLFALFGERGITDETVQRAGMSQILGREVTTRSDLTEAEARQVIASLEAHK